MAANVVNTNIKDTTYVNLLSVLELVSSCFFSFLIDLKINFSLVKRIIEFTSCVYKINTVR
jgi:hypothetical protein